MPEEKTIKDAIKFIDKNLVQMQKKIQEFNLAIEKLDKDYMYTMQMKNESSISKSYMNDIKANVSKLNILENAYNFEKSSKDLIDKVTNMHSKAKEIFDFYEDFRTVRTYDLGSEGKAFKFLNGFLLGFSEYYDFKPEFMGLIDLTALAKEVNGTKDGAKIKVPYDSLPKLIKKAYEGKLSNFVIEANGLKMSFYKDYKLRIVAESSMIKKIDKVASECEVFAFI